MRSPIRGILACTHTHTPSINAPLSFIAYLRKIKLDHPIPSSFKQVLTQYVSVRRASLHSARDRSLSFFFFLLLIMVFRPSGSQVLRLEIAAGDRNSNVVYFARSLIFEKKSVSMKCYVRAQFRTFYLVCISFRIISNNNLIKRTSANFIITKSAIIYISFKYIILCIMQMPCKVQFYMRSIKDRSHVRAISQWRWQTGPICLLK